MILKWDKLLSRDEQDKNYWLSRVIMNSNIDQKVIDNAMEKREYEVKLLIDGIEHDPDWINDVIQSMNEYINKEAKILANEKYQEAMEKGNKLLNIIEIAKKQICFDFNIDTDEE